jgi:DNA-binding PadR family transcriptional regulator
MKTETKDIFELLGIPNLPKSSSFEEAGDVKNDLHNIAQVHFKHKMVYQAIKEDCHKKISELNLQIETADRLIEMTSALEQLLKPSVKKSNTFSQPQLDVLDVGGPTRRLKITEVKKRIVHLFAARAASHNIKEPGLVQISNSEILAQLGALRGNCLYNWSNYYKDEFLIERAEIKGNVRYWRLNQKGIEAVRQIIHTPGVVLDVNNANTIIKPYMSDKTKFLLTQIAKKKIEKLEEIRVSVRELIAASTAAKKTMRINASTYIYNWISTARYICKAGSPGIYKLTAKGIEEIKSITNE